MRGEGIGFVELRGREVVRTCQERWENSELERKSLLAETGTQASV